ncbi:SurA N-terminal domain-containing protein [Candidatus Azoamicus ciliaticola]|uniref:Uncharacterized protein n=1 Tax=Candidatus Azoamicus ciliaticola TaxID=2652803 RepID=A0A6J5JX96_9GAMM|nr:SurA N-terminal domain-containing protein [Candidatus Azoamicus ciliaticola]CAB3976446.1 Uncharacterised protein [Candidatus Azoamicus ciliaticola]
MNIKSITTWIIITLLSLSLAITTITNPIQKEKKNINKIDSFIITKNEIENILNKIKNIYPSLTKIENVNSILEKKLIEHITSNIKFKKTAITCEKKELVYLIKKSKIFQNNGNFSEEKYKKYLEKQKISENTLQKHIKTLSENAKITKLKKKYENENIKTHNLPHTYTYLEKNKYKLISKKKLIQNTKIKKDFITFEKKHIENYKIATIYKILYENVNNKTNKYILVYQNDINEKILKLINKNEKTISLLTKHGNFLIKKINIIKQKLNKKTYKKDLINKYKTFKIKKLIKNKEKNIKSIGQEKIVFTSAKCKKNYTLTNIKKNDITKNKNGIIIIEKKYNKKLKIINNKKLKIIKEIIESKKQNLKKMLINTNHFNENQTYLW